MENWSRSLMSLSYPICFSFIFLTNVLASYSANAQTISALIERMNGGQCPKPLLKYNQIEFKDRCASTDGHHTFDEYSAINKCHTSVTEDNINITKYNAFVDQCERAISGGDRPSYQNNNNDKTKISNNIGLLDESRLNSLKKNTDDIIQKGIYGQDASQLSPDAKIEACMNNLQKDCDSYNGKLQNVCNEFNAIRVTYCQSVGRDRASNSAEILKRLNLKQVEVTAAKNELKDELEGECSAYRTAHPGSKSVENFCDAVGDGSSLDGLREAIEAELRKASKRVAAAPPKTQAKTLSDNRSANAIAAAPDNGVVSAAKRWRDQCGGRANSIQFNNGVMVMSSSIGGNAYFRPSDVNFELRRDGDIFHVRCKSGGMCVKVVGGNTVPDYNWWSLECRNIR